jgi:transcriptional regulator with XRE-family HTH domain
MPSEPTILNKASPGSKARQQRVASLLTRRELADLAGIPVEHVSLFEQGLPVPLDSRRRIMRELWSRKNGK